MRSCSCTLPCSWPAIAPAGKRSAFVAALIALAISGCGKGHSDSVPLYPVEGQVVWQGKPLVGVRGCVFPLQPAKDKHANTARAHTDSNGRFNLTTFAAGDGAAEGEYAVVVTCNPVVNTGGGLCARSQHPAGQVCEVEVDRSAGNRRERCQRAADARTEAMTARFSCQERQERKEECAT